MFMVRFKSTFLHKYGICLNKYPESVQVTSLVTFQRKHKVYGSLLKSVQNMTFA